MRKVLVIFALFCAFFKLFADDDKLRLAVMEFEDRSGEIPKKTLSDATEYLRGALISANKYIVIAQERQSQAMVKDMKKESYKECNDKNCQIQLGQALSADTILRTTITRLGKTFVIASELIDLEKEATVVGAREKYDGTENSMSEALDNIAEKVIAAYESIQHEEGSNSDQAPEFKQDQEPSKDSRDCEQARKEDSITAWKTYLRKHSNGECAEEAKEKLDKMSCEEAEQENTLKAWKKYANEFREGDCIIKAEERIKKFEKKEKIAQEKKEKENLEKVYSKADERMDRKFTGRYNFGIAAVFNGDNQFGVSTGFDFNFNVFQKPLGGGAGNLFVGFGFDLEYYAPTDHGVDHHILEVPIMLNFGYDFRVNNYTLRYIGFWFSAGASIDTWFWEDDWDDVEHDIQGSFAWELGFNMIFRSRFIMNFGFGGFAGEASDASHFFFNIGRIF